MQFTIEVFEAKWIPTNRNEHATMQSDDCLCNYTLNLFENTTCAQFFYENFFRHLSITGDPGAKMFAAIKTKQNCVYIVIFIFCHVSNHKYYLLCLILVHVLKMIPNKVSAFSTQKWLVWLNDWSGCRVRLYNLLMKALYRLMIYFITFLKGFTVDDT